MNDVDVRRCRASALARRRAGRSPLVVAAASRRGARRRTAPALAAARAETAELRDQLDALEAPARRPRAAPRSPPTRVRRSPTSASPSRRARARGPTGSRAALFADLVLRETVVKAASLAHGVRRALAPETRNRIRFEMRREVKRSRKQRRADTREARREWEARQRAASDADDERGTRRMSRGLWFVAGAGAGVYVMVRGRRAAEALTVDGLQDRLSGARGRGCGCSATRSPQGQAEKETELRERLGLVPHGTRARGRPAPGRRRPTAPTTEDKEGSS